MARRFRFRLEAVLDVRRLREREAQRGVAEQRAAIARLDQLNEQTIAAIAVEQEALRGRQAGGAVQPLALAQSRAWIAHLRNTIVQRQPLRAQHVTRLAEALEKLRQARVQTRTIEKLRDRRWSEYRRQRDRREQAQMDELARQMLATDGGGAAAEAAAAERGALQGVDSR